MTKRKCKSKYRGVSPDPPEIDSPPSRDKVSGSPLPFHISGSLNRADSVPRVADIRSRSSAKAFEVSQSPDSIHSPYHLHSSDNPGLVLVPDLLDGNNYGTWIIAVTTSIEAKNKFGFVDGSILKPHDNDPYYNIWKRCNSMVKSWLLNSISKKIYTSVLYFPTAAEIWKDLHTRFHKSNLPRLYKLRQQIHSLRQGNMDLSSYHTQTQSLWEELASLQVSGTSVEELLAERETNRVIGFLMGLSDGYDNVRSQLLMKKSLPSLSEVYNILDQEDAQRSARSSQTIGSDSSAFQISQQPTLSQSSTAQTNEVQNSTYAGNPRKDRPVCTFCGRMGHIMDRCYKKHGFPVGFQSRQRNIRPMNVASTVTIEQDGHDHTSFNNNNNDDLSPHQIQQIVSFLSTKFQPSSAPKPEVHSVSVSSTTIPSPTLGPISGSFSGINDWNG